MAEVSLEGGYNGQLVSLGGIRGLPGQGRKISGQNLTGNGAIQILSPNLRRIAVIIQNQSGLEVELILRDTLTSYRIKLEDHGTFQIDDNFPWTGSVMAYAGAATWQLSILECEVP